MSRCLLLAAIALALVACATAAEFARGASAVGSAGCAASWHAVASPRVKDGELSAFSAPAANDAWAVGETPSRLPPAHLPRQTLIEHWNGANWRLVTGALTAGQLTGVAASDAQNVWVVGATTADAPIIERWDGSKWSSTPVPWPLYPTAITSTGDGEIWVAGDGPVGAMILHWNGTRWLRVMRRRDAELADMTAISANDVWAVGNDSEQKLLALHWNGLHWKAYSMGAGPGHDLPSTLYSVSADATNDVWAVGSAHIAELNGYDADPIVRHWNGSRWTAPAPPGEEAGLIAVTATSASGPWVYGNDSFPFATTGGNDGSFLAVGSGSAWKETPMPQRTINDLGADPSGTFWAVGWLGSGVDPDDGFPIHTTPLVERYTC